MCVYLSHVCIAPYSDAYRLKFYVDVISKGDLERINELMKEEEEEAEQTVSVKHILSPITEDEHASTQPQHNQEDDLTATINQTMTKLQV